MSKDWEEDFGLENGNYSCTCCYCKSQFIGYKRRVVCKECHDEIKATKDSIYNEAEDDVERLEDKLADEQNSLQIALADVERLEAEIAALKETGMQQAIEALCNLAADELNNCISPDNSTDSINAHTNISSFAKRLRKYRKIIKERPDE